MSGVMALMLVLDSLVSCEKKLDMELSILGMKCKLGYLIEKMCYCVELEGKNTARAARGMCVWRK